MAQNTSPAVMQQRSEPHTSQKESWLPIPGWDGYQVSDMGRVCSWKQRSRTVRRTWEIDYGRPPRILKADPRKGYLSVLLIRNGNERQWFSIHRLVLTAFKGPPPDGHESAHDDGDKLNNRLSNLAWKTHAANDADKDRHGTRLRGEGVGNAKLTDRQAAEIRARSMMGVRHTVLATEFGVCRNTIGNVVSGRHYMPTDYQEG